MIAVSAALLLLQAAGALPSCKDGSPECQPWERDWRPASVSGEAAETLGPGPHVLIVSDGAAITRVEYPTGRRCLIARTAVRRQAAPPPNRPGIIYGPPRIQAVCVPR